MTDHTIKLPIEWNSKKSDPLADIDYFTKRVLSTHYNRMETYGRIIRTARFELLYMKELLTEDEKQHRIDQIEKYQPLYDEEKRLFDEEMKEDDK